ncbi:hypothetical protein KGQ20_02595 [Catenulispora sp. NF23]|uniref:hypothetical protein n=1 Tax=Catenulispora pinistramenti TaxID=2705254 RepID=UPI001BABD3A3|nr:hypothetical protein [Catenulispora pinistramenti]MBS2531654.1 hypothetical protein [Catenulispora pinistramenti]
MNLDMRVADAAGEPSEAASSLSFKLTLAILATLLVSTLGLQMFSKDRSPWAQRARLAYHAVWPQGWAFFSSDADLPTLSVFRLGSDLSEASLFIARQMSSSTLWGLSGASQAESREAQYIKDIVPADFWHPCDGAVTAGCLAGVRPLRLFNPRRPASLCGSFVFALAAPEARVGMKPATKAVVLNLVCAP